MLNGEFSTVYNIINIKIPNVHESTVLPKGFPTVFSKQDGTVATLAEFHYQEFFF